MKFEMDSRKHFLPIHEAINHPLVTHSLFTKWFIAFCIIQINLRYFLESWCLASIFREISNHRIAIDPPLNLKNLLFLMNWLSVLENQNAFITCLTFQFRFHAFPRSGIFMECNIYTKFDVWKTHSFLNNLGTTRKADI